MIIQSMLDNDLYKFTMQQAVLHQYPEAEVEYAFKCRTEGIDWRPYEGDIIKNINKMCRNIMITNDELDYLGKLRFIKKDYLRFLKLFRFNYDYVNVTTDNDGTLRIQIKGPWLHTILFEVPVLAIVSEVYSTDMSNDFDEGNRRLNDKVSLLQGSGIKFADFGTRRRHSFDWHSSVIARLKFACPHHFVGTSNVFLSKRHGTKAIGTMAHEWLQAHQALYRVADSQSMALDSWAKEYRGDLGIALSDVIGLPYFLADFDMFFAKLFDGTRQDSGDPYHYAEEIINHYKNMGVDPKTKTIVFSDGLDFATAIDLQKRYSDKIGVSFGIGTYLVNDFNYKAPQIVLKMTKCNGQPVAKLSDTPNKGMCTDESYLSYLKKVYDERLSKYLKGV